MKKITILSAVALATALMNTSCSSDFIEKTPDLSMTEDGVYSSASRIEAAMNGVYARMKHQYFMGGYCCMAGENRGNDMVNGGNNGYTMRDTYSMSVNASCIENDYMFLYAYYGINAANTMKENLESRTDLPIDDATKNQHIAECKFVRSISWYYLCQFFSQPYNYSPDAKAIPMHTTAVTGAGQSALASSTIAEVYAQILADTEDVSALPAHSASFDCTKASQAAAHMLRMRVYMCMNNWDKAIEEGEKVTGFSLAGSVAEMFDTPYYTKENIFSMPMTTNDRSGSQSHPAGYLTRSAGYIDTLNMRTGILSIEAYKLPTDARTNFMVAADGYSHPTHYEKYDELSTRLEWVHVFRYAETLLNLSECYYNKGNFDKAAELLDEVRSRSVATGDILDVKSLTGTALKEAIYNERRAEFLGEGMRGLDIARRAEDFYHPTTTMVNGKYTEEVVATPSDKTTYCWALPLYETTINTATGN